jgi:hypothetical protein
VRIKKMLSLDFYKRLFCKETRSSIRLGDGLWEENEMISEEDREMLEAEISKEEILKAIKGSYAEGLRGPMVSLSYFTKTFDPSLKMT